MKVNAEVVNQMLTILLFVFLFMSIGWFAPILAATYAPENTYVDSRSLYAPDVGTNSDLHYMCWDRYISQATTGTVTIEMILIREGEDETRVETFSKSAFLREADGEIALVRELPENIRPGSYYYVVNIEFTVANGQVERMEQVKSNVFQVRDDAYVDPTPCRATSV